MDMFPPTIFSAVRHKTRYAVNKKLNNNCKKKIPLRTNNNKKRN